MSKHLHDGHRERLKEEFLANGFFEGTPPHKVLELLLFYCVPRVDTNALAYALINKYKTISGVLDAPVEELLQFKGITRSNVGLLKMIMPVSRLYRLEKQENMGSFNTFDEACAFILENFSGLTTERLGVMYLDSSGRSLGFEFVSHGDSAAVGISTRSIIKHVLDKNANAIILAHNHPSGVALPSAADICNTEAVARAMSNINVKLLDHIIIVAGDYISMKQSSDYRHIFN